MSVEITATYENIPYGSMQNSTTTGTNALDYSTHFVDFNDFKTYRNVPKYATLEPGRNWLDGTFINLPNDPVGYGYISNIMTDSNGDFESNIVITRTYTINYTSPGLSIQFDTWSGDYPRTMNVKWYRGEDLIEEQNYNVDGANYFCDTQVQAYNKIVITIGNMTKPYRFLKIFNITDGITRQFYNDELENVEIIEAITNNNQALNINEAELKILPSNNTGVLFQRTLPFSIYRNNELFGRFFIDGSTSNSNKTIFELKIKDYINILDAQSYLGGIYSGITVANLVNEIIGDIPYELDSTLEDFTIKGYLPVLTKREALRQLAFSINAYIDTSREDKIVIKPFTNNRNRFISRAEIVNVEFTQKSITTKIELETQLLTTRNAQTDEIFNGVLSGNQTILFDEPKFNLTISGGTILSSNCNYAIISGTGGNVVLSGKTYETYSNIREKLNNYTVSTDIENVKRYNTTLTCNDFDILDKLNFVEYTIKSKFKMEDAKVGDLVNLDHKTCRISQLSYDLKQSNIYAEAQLEKFYYDADEFYIITEDGEELTTENEIVLEEEE